MKDLERGGSRLVDLFIQDNPSKLFILVFFFRFYSRWIRKSEYKNTVALLWWIIPLFIQ